MINHFCHAVEETLPWPSSSGADPTGGMTRLLYSLEWLETQQQFKKRMDASGLETRFGEVGNLYGRLRGSASPEQVILSGSHTDTVVNGGNLDDQFDALAAWLAIDWLETTYGAPLKTVEAASMAEEESSRFPYTFWGSKNIFRLANPDGVRNIQDAKDTCFVNTMNACGFTLSAKPLHVRSDINAFVELYIEQGCVLESNGQSIGVVSAIAGQRRYTVMLNGESNHAGTTPLSYRRDTVYAFSRTCSQSIEKAKKHGDPLVLTFGEIEPQPNTVNVVPRKTIFTVDCRRTDAEVLRDFTQQLESDMRAICDEMDIDIGIDLWMDETPVPMDAKLVATFTELREKKQLNYQVMHSGAGHGAQVFAPRAPTCVIFMPSTNGINHNPAERTNINDLAEGVRTLALMLHQLVWQK